MDRETLPAIFKPSNYDLAIDGINFAPDWTYEGLVTISGSVESAEEIVLNAYQLKIHSAQLKIDGRIQVAKLEYQEQQQRLKLLFDEEVASSHDAELMIRFQGRINDESAGFSRSKYKPIAPPASPIAQNADSVDHHMLFTFFQPCDARRAFPCFDEPALKASFELSIEVPHGQVALSNMPVEATTESSRSGSSPDWKWKVVKFERSPVMSTYLFTWAVGDFGYVEAFTERSYDKGRLPVRIYTTKGLEGQARFACGYAWKIVDLLSELFQIDYPLSKCDLLAINEFDTGAMEGWGLLTFQTSQLLFDEQNSDPRFRPRILNTIAHELAHQWFGNIVTMEWWNELWLNEGFATWLGWYVTDRLHPEWSIWGQFVADTMSQAFDLDSIRESHPVEVPVRNAQDISQIFDFISYFKGAAVIRMLSAYLGDKAFLQGIAFYLRRHAYGNARADDLWTALGECSGHGVNNLMSRWITSIGLPVVTVTEEQPGEVTLHQSRFLLSGGVKPEEDETMWIIPLALETGAHSYKSSILSSKQDIIQIASVDDTFYKINKDSIGFYRTKYPPARMSKFGSPEFMARLSTEDKIGLVSDAAALAASGHSSTPALLAYIEGCSNEDNYFVWTTIMSVLNRLRCVFSDTQTAKGLTSFILKLVTPAVEGMSWDFQPENEGLFDGQLRSLLLENAGLAGHEPTVKEAVSRFQRYTAESDMSAMHPSLRSTMFRIAIKTQGRWAYEAVQKVFLTSQTPDLVILALAAMGYVPTADLGREFLRFAFDGNVKLQDLHHVVRSLSLDPAVNPVVWDYMKENYEHVRALVPVRDFGDLLRIGLARYSSKEVHADITEFFATRDCRGFERGVGVVLDQIASASAYKERDAQAVEEWLAFHGYL